FQSLQEIARSIESTALKFGSQLVKVARRTTATVKDNTENLSENFFVNGIIRIVSIARNKGIMQMILSWNSIYGIPAIKTYCRLIL
ncbi:MAG: hypothetical protein PHS38_13965, partial [Bacteroidales bacterium]|nr:hypothetical protein [Bacteroidales bacterium]